MITAPVSSIQSTKTMNKRKIMTAKYQWLMVADPLLCGSGPILSRLRRCDRLNRGEFCLCRFHINDLDEDVSAIGGNDVMEWFENDVDADDMDDLVKEIAWRVAKAKSQRYADDVIERAQRWLLRFQDVAMAGSGLTGRYSDELDD